MATKKANKQAVSKVSKTESKVSASSLDAPKLRKWNLWLALLFAAQAVAIYVIGTAKTVPVTVSYPSVDPLASEAAGHQVMATASRTLWDARLACMVAVFLLAFALMHLLVATWKRGRYEARLKVGMNESRWLGLGVGGGLALVTVALLVGISDKNTLALMFFSMLVGSMVVAGAEELARREGAKRGMLSRMLCSAGALGVLVPLLVVTTTVGVARLFDGYAPGYFYGICITLVVAYAVAFLMTCMRVQRKGKWVSAMYTEQMYMWFGLIFASALAWQIFAGALQP
jgi:hypothetical protein